MQQKIVEVNGKMVSVKFYTQTHHGDISDELSKACSGAFIAEKDIYVVNEETFGEDSFNKAFLGRNKVEGGLKENLPYDPDDIRVFNNTIITYSIDDEVVGYFSVLTFYHKDDKGDVSNFNVRFMAGLPLDLRGTGIFYEDAFTILFDDLKDFQKNFPDANPNANIVQFAALSAATPGAVDKAANLIRLHVPVGDRTPRDTYATEMAIMFGLGSIIDPETGISQIDMSVKQEKFNPKSTNVGATMFNNKKGPSGTGMSLRQPLGTVDSLLAKEKEIMQSLIKSLGEKNSPSGGMSPRI